jgi:hypothetical protein
MHSRHMPNCNTTAYSIWRESCCAYWRLLPNMPSCSVWNMSRNSSHIYKKLSPLAVIHCVQANSTNMKHNWLGVHCNDQQHWRWTTIRSWLMHVKTCMNIWNTYQFRLPIKCCKQCYVLLNMRCSSFHTWTSWLSKQHYLSSIARRFHNMLHSWYIYTGRMTTGT